jgi:hypothetical protein
MACGGSSHIVQTLLPFFDGCALTSESIHQSRKDAISIGKYGFISKIADIPICGLSVNRQVSNTLLTEEERRVSRPASKI